MPEALARVLRNAGYSYAAINLLEQMLANHSGNHSLNFLNYERGLGYAGEGDHEAAISYLMRP